LQLVIGNKNYSTWSLRAWLLLRHFDLDFDEVQASLRAEGLADRLGAYSPSKRVPVLIDGDVRVWDSLAICEYISETYLEGAGWPPEPRARAWARAISAEMHAGFGALRCALPMNLRARRRVDIDDDVQRDIDRIDDIWRECYEDFDGPWLFGGFSIADCMYAPVALRFPTYGVEVSTPAARFIETVKKEAGVRAWKAAARHETEVVDADEAGVDFS